ncbi:MAG: flagellar hook-basal body complex protein FliE [Lachnospiraceae bacterium]|jgi:flagellar hook-basal body complex protein FliE|nr:flagellar hook-basal body complex protein FliE [Lachnospiraceae bacterium]
MNPSDLMKISGLNGLEPLSSAGSLRNPGKLEKLPGYKDSLLTKETQGAKTESFDSLLHSAMDMLRETNDYSNQAGEAELAYAMGITNSTHDLQVAQMKANISLQYTVAVRNAVIDAYKEIMQMQF